MQAGTIQDHLEMAFARIRQLEADVIAIKESLAEMTAPKQKTEAKGKGSD